jgi:hypothetical protein
MEGNIPPPPVDCTAVVESPARKKAGGFAFGAAIAEGMKDARVANRGRVDRCILNSRSDKTSKKCKLTVLKMYEVNPKPVDSGSHIEIHSFAPILAFCTVRVNFQSTSCPVLASINFESCMKQASLANLDHHEYLGRREMSVCLSVSTNCMNIYMSVGQDGTNGRKARGELSRGSSLGNVIVEFMASNLGFRR